MRRRIQPIREASSGRLAAASPGLRAGLLWISIVAVLLMLGCAAQAQSGAPQNANPSPPGSGTNASARVRAASNFAKLPLSFEENRGQADARVRFLARGPGYTLFLTNQEAVFAFPSRQGSTDKPPAALRLRFEHADPRAQITGGNGLPGRTNYFPSGDRSTWHTGIPNYAGVEYGGVYPGIDAVFHGNPQRLEFDFAIAPGADPAKIALDFAGGRVVRVDGEGNIVLGVGSSGDEVTLGRPVVYQQIAGTRRGIAGKFVLRGAHRIGFQVGAYDRAEPLVIDPSVDYVTYLNGSTGVSWADSIAIDSTGAAYVLGYTTCYDFPTQNGTGGSSEGDTFVSKFSPDGSQLVYTSLFAGGSTGTIQGLAGIAVDGNNSAYVAEDLAGSFTTPGAYSNPLNGLTIVKLSADGTQIVYAAQIGEIRNSEIPTPIAVDSNGNAYVASSTQSNYSYPTTPGAYATSLSCPGGACASVVAVTKLSADGTTLVYSTLLGGSSGNDGATSIAVDAKFDAYVAGATGSTDFPTTPGAVQTTCLSQYIPQPPYCADVDAFVTELNPTGSALVYSTFLGDGTIAFGPGAPQIALDGNGNAYVSGFANSTIFTNALNETGTIGGPAENCGVSGDSCANGGNSFLAKIAPGGTQLLYLGFLGGYESLPPAGQANGPTEATSVAVDSSGKAYLTGQTFSYYFPFTSDAYQGNMGLSCYPTSDCSAEAFLSVFDTTQAGNNSLVYSTYFGPPSTAGFGIATDGQGNAYFAGITESTSLQTTPGAFQAVCTPNSTTAGCEAAFLAEFTTATSGTAAAISAVSGGGQSAVIGQAFANPLVVKVTDASNDPVSGATVTFSVPASGASASLSATTATTGSDGTASVTATANGIASSTAYTMSAAVTGVTTPATFALTNTQAATTLTVTPSAISLVYGQPATITAAISPSNIDGSVPTGSVNFYDGTTALAPAATVSNAAAIYTVNVPAVGSHAYSAQYLGNADFEESAETSAASAVVVGKAGATLAGPATQPVTVSSGEAGSIAITANGQYSGSGIATPSGSVSYSVSGNGFPAGTAAISDGKAAITIPAATAPGSYTVTVNYAGDANYAAATSITVSLTVTPPAASVIDNETITVSDADTVLPGALSGDKEAITVADTVSVQVSGYPILMITDNEAITVSDAGIRVLPGDLSGDNESITVADTVSVHVAGTQTTTTLTSSANPSPAGYNVTFTATVAPSGASAGSITFMNGTTTLATLPVTGNVATYTTNSLLPGANQITAVYSGSSGYFTSTSAALDEQISSFLLDFSNHGSLDLLPGQSASFAMTVTPTNGPYNQPVAFSVGGLPPGASGSFDPASVTPGNSPATTTLTITIPSANSQSQPPAIFRDAGPVLLAILMPAAAFYRKRRALRSILLALMAVCALGTLATLSGCGSSGFFNQPPKTWTITVTGSSGAAQQSTTLTVTVE